MKWAILFTVLFLAGGYLGFAVPPLAVPFFAVFGIYLVWKIYDFQTENAAIKADLKEIKALLQARSPEAAPEETSQTEEKD